MIDNIEKFEGTLEEFLSTFKYGQTAYFLKYRGQNSTKVWWETKDEWFLNIARGKKNPEIYKDPSMILRKSALHYLDYMFISEGYEIHLETSIDE